MDNNFDRLYCITECLKGKIKSKELLSKHNSVYDAALDMDSFVTECSKTCERCNACQE